MIGCEQDHFHVQPTNRSMHAADAGCATAVTTYLTSVRITTQNRPQGFLPNQAAFPFQRAY
jgi:hypothetical protein